MSREIDERVVSMRFDNRQFESGVHESMNTISKLKDNLNFDGIAKGINNLSSSVENVDMNPLSSAVTAVSNKFSAMEIVGITAIMNITNSAVNAGKSLAKSLSLDQITAGWGKYEQKTASVQTIMNSTGKSIDEVNQYLSKLMWFSDETSYGFTDMTSALAQMTSAGGNIDNLIPLITGVANATAYAGKGASEFSRAMYNLNQSYSAGSLQYMDWKSLELAGIGSEQLKKTFIDIGVELGKISEGEVTIANFGQTLSKRWADTEVMEKAFGKFGALTEAAYTAIQNGEFDTAAEAIESLSDKFDELSVKAFKSAQEAKSFTEAIDATKDAVSSGWLRTFEIIFGNYEEAKTMWTELANTLWDVFASGAEARNEMLEEWKSLGGRDELIQSFKEIYRAITELVEPVKEAFRSIFPKKTAQDLKKLTSRILEITSSFKVTEETADKLRDTFKGMFAAIDAILTVTKKLASAVWTAVKPLKGLFSIFLDITAAIGRFLTNIRDSIKETTKFGTIIENISIVLSNVSKRLVDVMSYLSKNFVATGFQVFYKVLQGIFNILKKLIGYIKKVFAEFARGIQESSGAINSNTVISLIGSGLLIAAFAKIKDFIDDLREGAGGLKDVIDGIADIFSAVEGALKSWQRSLDAKTLMRIAGAIGILAASILTISTIEPGKLAASLGAITGLFAELFGSMSIMTKIAGSKGKQLKNTLTSTTMLIKISIAMLIAATALKTIGSLGIGQIASGLYGLAGAMIIMLGTVKIIDLISKNGTTSVAALIPIAASMILVSLSLKILGTMSWEAIGKSLTAMAGALLIMTGVIALLGLVPTSAIGIVGIIALSASLLVIAASLKFLGTMSWDSIGRSLVAMAGALVILGGIALALGALAPFAAIGGAVLLMLASSFAILAVGMAILAPALALINALNVKKLTGQLIGLGGALLIFGLLAGVSPKTSTRIGVLGENLVKLSAGLLALSLLDIKQVSKSMKALTKTLFAFGAAGLALSPLMPFMFALTTIFIGLGVGAVALGAGLIVLGLGITSMSGALSALINTIVEGVKKVLDGIVYILDAIIRIKDRIITIIKDLVKDVFEIGVNVVRGFINGIKYAASELWEGIKSVFGQVADWLRGVFKIHSPSRVTEEIGEYFDEGFVVGVKEYSNRVEDATEEVGEKAIDSLSGAMASISDTIDENMDLNPVITPVVDLDGVKSGLNKINGMSTSSNVMARLGSINSLMKNQNGELDLLEAINGLNSKLSGLKVTVYNVNGITYDDGSAVSNAVENLIRAAKIERRI